MPIRHEFRHLYRTKAWKRARARVLRQAQNRCEACGKPNRAVVFTYSWKTRDLRFAGGWRYHMVWMKLNSRVWRDERGLFFPLNSWPSRGLPRRVKVQIGVAHADNDPTNMDDSNLRAWCQWHHLHFDQGHHRESRCVRKDRTRELLAWEECA